MKAAILIDGGYFLKRLGSVRKDIDLKNAITVDRAVGELVHGHLNILNRVYNNPNPISLLYRCFYYDAVPYGAKAHQPISKKSFDYDKSDQAKFRRNLFELLKKRPNFALRWGM